jgi:FKBP-type peptidyl-prolyl cis-trans isomerase
MKKLATLTLSLFLTTGMTFADSPKDSSKEADAQPAKPTTAAKPATAKSTAEIAAEMEELRQALQAQQEQLQMLKEELAKRDKQIEEARETAASANSRATEANAKASEAAATSAEVKASEASLSSTVSSVKSSNDALNATVSNMAGSQEKNPEQPVAIHYKGITITPGGFLAAESAYRTRSAQADVNTPFTGIPFPGNDLSRTSEFNFSGRQSRLSFLFEGKADTVKLTGYYELDWLGTGVTSNNRQSNSYVMRQRQVWGQAAFTNGWTVTGGQMWSLATETRKGLDNRTEATPLTIDAQYNVGFTWARQYGFRVTKNFSNKAWFGVSVEGPQITVTNHNSPTPFLVGGAGAGGGLLNFVDTTGYSANSAPDFIVKTAFEPGWGHYEVFGVISNFRARTYPCGAPTSQIALPAGCPGTTPSSANPFSDNRTGGGIGVNFRAPVDPGKKLDLGLHVFGGDGVGRYSSAQLPDATVRPNGTLALIRGGSALGTLEFHPNPKLDVYFDYGIEYAFRADYTYQTTATPSATVAVGYGSPLFNNSGCGAPQPLPGGPFVSNSASGCTGDIRYIQEGTLGFWHKLYQGPKGGLRWGIQYSYIFKTTWSGNNNAPTTPGVSGKAVDNMVFTSFRYYIP